MLSDPETYEWDPLDSDLLARLSSKKYVSMSRERHLGLPPLSASNGSVESKVDAGSSESKGESELLETGKLKDDSKYIAGEEDSDQKARHEEGSLFDVGMPGVMTTEEVLAQTNLGAWKLKLGAMILELQDLGDWEETEVTERHTVKGVAAELAATIGPQLVRETAIEWQH